MFTVRCVVLCRCLNRHMFCPIKTFGLQLHIFATTELNNAPKLHRGCPASFNGHQNKTADIGRKAVRQHLNGNMFSLQLDEPKGPAAKTLRIHYNCWQEKWLVVPACRADPNRCISVVSGANGWGIREMSQKAFFFNMPVAFAVANSTAAWQLDQPCIQS